MLLDYMRILLDTGSLSDKSLDNQDDSINTTVALTSSDYIYVGQRLPFTNLFLYSHVANTNTATLSVEYWNGTSWISAVDLLDGTSASGKTFAKSGIIQWSSEKSQGWQCVYDTSDSNSPASLQSITIYDCYWARLKVSATLSATTALKEITYAFTSTQELKKIDVEIDSYLSAFASGKTEWNQEITTASKLLVTDLKRLGFVAGPGQVIELDDLYMAATFKCLELLYFNLGPSYKDRMDKMRKEYESVMNIQNFTLDSNKDGLLDQSEMGGTIRRLIR